MSFFLRSLLLLFLVAGPVTAQTETILPNSNPVQGGWFGHAVALDGDRMVVGAPQDDRAGAYYIGSVSVFDRTASGWSETTVLVPPTSDPERFGNSVALEDDRIVVGSPGSMGGTGIVRVYDLIGGTWTLTQSITASDATPQSGYGYTLALEGNRIAVSAPAVDQYVGAVYVYDLVGGAWTETTKLAPASPTSTLDMMGLSVALDGTRVVAGAPGVYSGSSAPGAVHLFEEGATSWIETVVTPSDPSAAARFGESVALEGGVLAIGSAWVSIDAGRQGALYVFEDVGGQWIEQVRIDGSQPDVDRMLGFRVDLDSGRLAVSEIGAGIPYSRTTVGRVILVEDDGTGWKGTTVIEGSDSGQSDYFGSAIDLDGSRLAVGAYLKADGTLANAGGAYVYDLATIQPPPPFLAGIAASIYKVDALEGDLHSNSVITSHRQPVGYAGSYMTNLTAVGAIRIDRRVVIDGDVTSGNYLTVDPLATVTGTQTANGTVRSIPLPAVVQVSPGSQNVTVASGQTQAIAPGAYNRLRVEGTVTLTAGTYDLNRFLVRPNAEVQFDVSNGPITINVKTKAFVARDAVVAPFTNGAANPSLSDQVTLRTAQSLIVTIGNRSLFVGAIEAPLATVRLNGGATLVGGIASREIHASNGSSLYAHGTSSTPALGAGPQAAVLASAQTSELSLTAAPNPFGTRTTLTFSVLEAAPVRLAVYDALGREVVVLADGALEAGTHTAVLAADDLPVGAYAVRLSSPQGSVTRMLTLVR